MSDNVYETGFLRVINHSALAGVAQLELIGSVNRSLSSVTFVLDAKGATNVDAAELTFETTDNDSYVSTDGKRVRIF